MASDETITTVHSSMMHESEDDDVDVDDEYDYHPNQRYNMSRLSICTTNSKNSMNDEDDPTIHMSNLSLSIDDDNRSEMEADGEAASVGFGSDDEDSDKESAGWFSLPIRRRGGMMSADRKEYVSDEEAKIGQSGRRRKQQSMRLMREKWLERAWGMRRCKRGGDEESGEGECVVIARPTGGERCLCMDMDEVKACKDLGFELQHEWTVEIPSRISASAVDTDSGGNSPIASWRVSSPGDDPRDVKARLKIWAQAVALASAAHLNN